MNTEIIDKQYDKHQELCDGLRKNVISLESMSEYYSNLNANN